MNKNIGFFVRHFTERGTEVAIYDYAKNNELILGNKSFIICFDQEYQRKINFPQERDSYNKFKEKFEILEINEIKNISKIIKKYNLSFFHTLTHGGPDIYQFENKGMWENCKTIKHCVFNTTHKESDYYISISDFLNEKYGTKIPVVPHMVDIPDVTGDLRDELGIPKDAFVIGRSGGFGEFNIGIAHQAIIETVQKTNNLYFLFMNTNKFFEHKKIIYTKKNTNLIYKSKFINTCDAMIHARAMGETFGLTIAEFSSKNKPIITSKFGDLEHIKILKENAILYSSKEELIEIFDNIIQIKNKKQNWNSYENYTPKNVMKIFEETIFNS